MASAVMKRPLLILLVANAAYLAALPAANLFYIANILLHLALGAIVCAWLLIWQSRSRSLKMLRLS